MTLDMYSENPQDIDNAFADSTVETGAMGDCVSVIVLWDYHEGFGQYLKMRGQHGRGGIEAIDQGHFLQGIPAEQHLLAFVCTSYENETLVGNLTRRANEFFTGYDVEVNVVSGRPSYVVNRNGQVD